MTDSKTKPYTRNDDVGVTQPYRTDPNKTQAYGSDKTIGYGIERGERTDRTEAHGLGVSDTLELNDKKYQVLAIISDETQTGEAVIYKVRSDGNIYALKLYYSFRNPKDEPNPEALARIQMINDPDILRLYDFGTGANKYRGKFCFEICQFATGGNLLNVPDLKEKYTVEFLTSNVIPEIFKGIRTLHDYKIYHCDLKPENVYYLDEEQTDLIIGDYGSAKTFEETSKKELAHTTTTKGTEFYLAPEQARGVVSKKNDYYSFGMILLHLIYPEYVNRESLHKIIERQFARKPIIDFDPKYGRINDLIAGLTLYDIECRWGEEEVKAWLRGEQVPVNYWGSGEARVQPINLGKSIIRTIGDLTEYIESNEDWCDNLIEDREGYSLLLRWVADLQGLDKKKIFDKMVRTYQQDGEEFLKEAILRYFTPQRSIRIDMKEYDFWKTDDIESLIKEFFVHLDDIWKITPTDKMKFYMFELEFNLRQMENLTEGKIKITIQSILEKISSTISVSSKKNFDDYICVFYPELNNERLLRLFYAFNKDRNFKDLENNSYETIEKIGIFFANNEELFNNDFMEVEKNVYFDQNGLSNLKNLEYSELLFEIFKDKVTSEIRCIAVSVSEKGHYILKYSCPKSLTEYFSKVSVNKEFIQGEGKTFSYAFTKEPYETVKSIFQKFLHSLEKERNISHALLPEKNKKEFFDRFKKELQATIKKHKTETRFKYLQENSKAISIICGLLVFGYFAVQWKSVSKDLISSLFTNGFAPFMDSWDNYCMDHRSDGVLLGLFKVALLFVSLPVGLIGALFIYIFSYTFPILAGGFTYASSMFMLRTAAEEKMIFPKAIISVYVIFFLAFGGLCLKRVGVIKNLNPFHRVNLKINSTFTKNVETYKVDSKDKKIVFPNTSDNREKKQSPNTTIKSIATINTSAANIRSGPSTRYRVIGVCKKGEVFEILTKSGGWYKVRYKNKEGYISGKLVRHIQSR